MNITRSHNRISISDYSNYEFSWLVARRNTSTTARQLWMSQLIFYSIKFQKSDKFKIKFTSLHVSMIILLNNDITKHIKQWIPNWILTFKLSTQIAVYQQETEEFLSQMRNVFESKTWVQRRSICISCTITIRHVTITITM